MSFGYPSTSNPLPAKHSGPNTTPVVSGVKIINYPKSTQTTKS